jgi:tRNA-dihydrouridine synthase A
LSEKPAEQAVFEETRANSVSRKVSVAPMMDWTDRHCRYFLRGFSPDTLLYTEMITAAAILRGNRLRLLEFHPEEHPVALQLGGSEPEHLAEAARAGEDAGYDEINLNCGCPSERVVTGAFGACLMREPGLVADCVAAMRAVVRVPVTVKMRIGIVNAGEQGAKEKVARHDDEDFAALHEFVRQIRDAGCDVAIVHARKAMLGGWSPKDNREIPPLRYDVVERLTKEFPQLPVVVNGGFRTAAAALEVLEWADGVMLGREAYHRPRVLAELSGTDVDSFELLERMARYAEVELARGERLPSITRHMLGLFSGEPGAREYRRLLSEGAREPGAGADLIRRAARAQFGLAERAAAG